MLTPAMRLAALVGALLVFSACSAGGTTPGTEDAPREVRLTMTADNAFDPPRIEVTRGETVRFVVRNASDEAHEAYVGTAAEQRAHATDHSGFGPEEQGDAAHMGYGVHVPPRGDGVMVVTFDQGTEYLIGCHYPGHYEAGMRAVIEVSQ